MTDAPQETVQETQAARRPEMKVRPTAPIVPPSNVSGNALMAVIAIMAFLACLTFGAVSMVRATAASWQSQISREITIQIKPDDGLDMDQALVKARDLALTFVGTKEGQIMDDEATARLLEPWLGPDLPMDSLPMPALVAVTQDGGLDLEALRIRLSTEAPGAVVDDHDRWREPMVAAASRLREEEPSSTTASPRPASSRRIGDSAASSAVSRPPRKLTMPT